MEYSLEKSTKIAEIETELRVAETRADSYPLYSENSLREARKILTKIIPKFREIVPRSIQPALNAYLDSLQRKYEAIIETGLVDRITGPDYIKEFMCRED